VGHRGGCHPILYVATSAFLEICGAAPIQGSRKPSTKAKASPLLYHETRTNTSSKTTFALAFKG